MEERPRQSLWTYDFTVITLGSVISMVGGAMTNFAMSIMVLELTGSTFLYGLFYACVQLPMLVFPLLAGPYLDRMSRKKVIYRLDFLSAGLYLLLFLLLRRAGSAIRCCWASGCSPRASTACTWWPMTAFIPTSSPRGT